ncbi:ABC transporter substrate-binding protein [Rhodococcus qingshengii]|uniref:ABC transporter substrate-binding protein n=1 Tax=Rhodococcus qingshengii TaxID=334542 RepID=UPI00187818DD|nr:ABC transporter substrate-binding protein [Rhodococcus qingshengii]QOS62225.1 ABC transporter substrate-binding protein [Rhodococcus qingshengii]
MRQQWGLRATALAATATALVGCSVGGDDADASETGESSAVPAPQKLLALDEFAALNALTLGVKPDTVFATLQSQAAKEILQSEGIEVVDKPTFFQSPDVEQIAAVHPDRILLSDVGSLTSITAQANEIAPTTVLAYAAPWREVLNTAATALGRESEAREIVSRLETKFAEVSGTVEAQPQTLSVLVGFSGGIYTVIPESPMSSIIEEAGFGRPQAELDAKIGPNTGVATSSVSGEEVGQHAADAMVVTSGNIYDGALVHANPLFNEISAVKAGRTADVSGELWFGSYPFAVYWILEDLEALADRTLTGAELQGRIASDADAVTRWKAFSK